jgi:hypothetical protein
MTAIFADFGLQVDRFAKHLLGFGQPPLEDIVAASSHGDEVCC